MRSLRSLVTSSLFTLCLFREFVEVSEGSERSEYLAESEGDDSSAAQISVLWHPSPYPVELHVLLNGDSFPWWHWKLFSFLDLKELNLNSEFQISFKSLFRFQNFNNFTVCCCMVFILLLCV